MWRGLNKCIQAHLRLESKTKTNNEKRMMPVVILVTRFNSGLAIVILVMVKYITMELKEYTMILG